MNSMSKAIFLGLLFASGTTVGIRAQSVMANAQISSQAAGGGFYDYTVTLNNTSASTSIETFWFSWVPGEDFLPSSPTSVQAPTGWTYSIKGGPYYYYGYSYYDGYSLEFTTPSTPLAAGASLTFGFVSPDSPNAIAGDNPYFGYPIGTSYVFSGGNASGTSEQFLVQTVVPEPSSLNFIAAGLTGLLVGRRRRLKASPA